MTNRRIENELKRMKNMNVSWEREQNMVSIVVSPQCTICFRNLQYYPFQPPRIFVNEMSYSHFLHLCSPRFFHMYQKWFPHSCCLRCESYDCSFRWNVMCNFSKVMEEIQEYAKRKWMIYRLVIMEPCFRQSKIPDELIREIVSFLYTIHVST